MKSAFLAFTLCFVFTTKLFASDLFDHEQGLTAGASVAHYHGDGWYHDMQKNTSGKYLVALKISALDNNRLYLYWDIVFADGEELYGLILQKNGNLIKVYVPTDADNLDDISNYEEAGWGYSSTNGNETEIFINYLYVDGRRYDEHFFVQRHSDGKWTIRSNGSIGSDQDGMIERWRDQVQPVAP